MAFRSMLGLRALTYDPMKGDVSNLSASDEQLQAEVLRLRIAHNEENVAEIRALHRKAASMELELAAMRKREQEQEKLAQEREAYLQQLERDLAAYKMLSEDLQRSCDEVKARLARADEEHKDAIERACDNALKQGKDTGMQQGLITGSMVGAHRCRCYLLMTPYGQAFLQALVRDLPEAFLHSEDFWNRMSVPMKFWVGAIVDETLTQLE